MFQRNLLPPSSGQKSKTRRNVVWTYGEGGLEQAPDGINFSSAASRALLASQRLISS
jgi:hypothetical protein